MLKSLREMVYLVDDDVRVREAIVNLLESQQFEVTAFGSAAAYLDHIRADGTSCLILDLELPDISGLDLQKQLINEESMPIIFISGHGDVPTTVQAMKAGALEFLTKPIDEERLVESVREALVRDQLLRVKRLEINRLRARYTSLTPREREVFHLIVGGLLIKQAASVLNIAEITFQVHRGNVMRKMAANSFADLVRMATKLGVEIRAEQHHNATSEKRAHD